MKFYTSFGVIF